MPSVRKTTHFTDGALFSFLSHPLFLLPLPGPSPYPLDRFRFQVLSPGSVYRSDSRQRHSFFGTKVCIANMHPTITRKTMQRHMVLAAKGCIANRKTGITGKILQRHRLFGSKECVASGCTVISDRKSVSRTVWVQNSVSREKEVDFMRQASQQEPPCGISQKDKGCGQGGGRSRRP
jgi:hypothetical protein